MHPSSHKISNPGGQNEVAVLRCLIEHGKDIAIVLRGGKRVQGTVAWSDIHNIAISGVRDIAGFNVEGRANIVIPKGSIEFWAYEV